MKKIDAEDLLKSGRYLPVPLRDFHKQKGLFKTLWRFYERQEEREKAADPFRHPPLEGLNWLVSHIYVIDWFLWFMARYGYTLRKDPRITPSRDLDEDIRETKADERLSLVVTLSEGRPQP